MPEVGRWFTIDPLAIAYHENTPYNYALNNPIYFKDPDGRKVLAHDEETQNIIIGYITDQLGENHGFSFNKKGVLQYDKKSLKKARGGFNDEQNSIASGLIDVIANEDRIIDVRINENSDEFTVDVYEPDFAKDERGAFIMEDGKPKREGWRKTDYQADLNTANSGGALFWDPGDILKTPKQAYGYIAINRKTASTIQIKGNEGKLTTPSESSVFIHEILDHGRDFIQNGNVNNSSGQGVENVKYHNQALKNISKGQSPLRETHYD